MSLHELHMRVLRLDAVVGRNATIFNMRQRPDAYRTYRIQAKSRQQAIELGQIQVAAHAVERDRCMATIPAKPRDELYYGVRYYSFKTIPEFHTPMCRYNKWMRPRSWKDMCSYRCGVVSSMPGDVTGKFAIILQCELARRGRESQVIYADPIYSGSLPHRQPLITACEHFDSLDNNLARAESARAWLEIRRMNEAIVRAAVERFLPQERAQQARYKADQQERLLAETAKQDGLRQVIVGTQSLTNAIIHEARDSVASLTQAQRELQ